MARQVNPSHSVGGTPVWDNPSATDGAMFVATPRTPSTVDNRASKRILDALSHMDLDPRFVAQFMVTSAGAAMQERILTFALSLIKNLAETEQARGKIVGTPTTKRALRIHRQIGSL